MALLVPYASQLLQSSADWLTSCILADHSTISSTHSLVGVSVKAF